MKAGYDAYLLGCDIDDTLVATNNRPEKMRDAGDAALLDLNTAIEARRAEIEQPFYYGLATGRLIDFQIQREEENEAFKQTVSIMDFKITSVGTAIYYRSSEAFVQDTSWPPERSSWHRDRLASLLAGASMLPGVSIEVQPDNAQSAHKLSYMVSGVPDHESQRFIDHITPLLGNYGLRSDIAFSGGRFLDFLPEGVAKGSAAIHTGRLLLAQRNQHLDEAALKDKRIFTITAGDSGNDRALLKVADLAIIPGNAHDSLKEWAVRTIPSARLYCAEAHFAKGIHEGLVAHGLLG